MSFHAILEQACVVLGFSYVKPNPDVTRDGKFQAHHSFCPPYQCNSPLFEIYGSLCDRECEAKGSALIHALAYISEVLDFKIEDFIYMVYLFKKMGDQYKTCVVRGCTLC
jgi:hypothetical protein